MPEVTSLDTNAIMLPTFAIAFITGILAFVNLSNPKAIEFQN